MLEARQPGQSPQLLSPTATSWPDDTLCFVKTVWSAEQQVVQGIKALSAKLEPQAGTTAAAMDTAEPIAATTQAAAAPTEIATSSSAVALSPAPAQPPLPSSPAGAAVGAGAGAPSTSSPFMSNQAIDEFMTQFEFQLSEKGPAIEFTTAQRRAVATAVNSPVMLLTGAAGCGKTYVTKAIVELWRQQGKRVAMCAPTGGRGRGGGGEEEGGGAGTDKGMGSEQKWIFSDVLHLVIMDLQFSMPRLSLKMIFQQPC